MKKLLLTLVVALAAVSHIFAQGIEIKKGGINYTNGEYFAWLDIVDYSGAYVGIAGYLVSRKGTRTMIASIWTARQQRRQMSNASAKEAFDIAGHENLPFANSLTGQHDCRPRGSGDP